jgi:pilus assembly protein Flp/PilA
METTQFTTRFEGLWTDDEGATAIEYSLLAALIAVVIIGGATAVGGAIDGTLSNIASELGFAP